MPEKELGSWPGGGSVPTESRCGGSLWTMAAGRGATPTPAKGRCSGCRSHGTGAQPETGPSEGVLWPPGALQLCLGKVTAEGSQAKTEPDRHGDPGPAGAEAAAR